MESPQQWIETAAWIGRQQAFALIATKCTAAQAQCLKQIHDARLYEKLGLTWEAFCKQYAGLSRSQADAIIRQLEEFGESYFRLSEIARISPETFRRIQHQVSGDVIEVEGQKLLLTPENAPKIRAAIEALRVQLRRSRAALPPARSIPGVYEAQTRLDALVEELSAFGKRNLPPGERTALRGLLDYAVMKLTKLSRSLENAAP
jgi:hypothetical protein